MWSNTDDGMTDFLNDARLARPLDGVVSLGMKDHAVVNLQLDEHAGSRERQQY